MNGAVVDCSDDSFVQCGLNYGNCLYFADFTIKLISSPLLTASGFIYVENKVVMLTN